MTGSTIRGITLGLLASTALASPALAQSTTVPVDKTPQTATTQSPAPGTNATSVTSSPAVQQAQDGQVPDETEIIITAQKREENLQDVPISVQAIGTRRLDQLNISNFEDYTKQLPSVSFQTIQPGSTTVYMRGVATGGDGNHSGSFPSVGFYLDEQPITTIGGTLDVHIYDIARIESLAGPQGTLYGASSQAGTIRIITNKPELGVTSGRVDSELNRVAHGDMGGALEGMINLPLGERMAFRASAFYQRDGGYIDNIRGSRTYCGDPVLDDDDNIVGCVRNGFTIDNEDLVENDFNDVRTYGGRAALKIDLDDNWTVTPTIMHQNSKTDGVFYYERPLGDLNTRRFRDEPTRDKFTQVALTIEGKIFNFDVTYAGAYLKRPTYGISDYSEYTAVYDDYYETYGGLANYLYFEDNAGNDIDPTQYIIGRNNFKKMSHEVRIATPQDRLFRVIGGAFYQKQTNDIFQDYRVDNLSDALSVNGSPGSLWLTKQDRVDKDYAVFGEASFDLTPQITLTGGGRLYKYNNSLFGFAGFGRDPRFDAGEDVPPNVVGSTRTGVAECFTADGNLVRFGGTGGFAPGSISGIPCTNVGVFEDGRVKPKRTKDSGFTHRLNAQYKPNDNMMFYSTWSRGFRPGGINRRAALAPYGADFLTNYELGWKTTIGPVRWNGAVYRQLWKKFQFSFLGENSLTVIQNGRDAKITGIESDINYTAGGLTLNAAAALTNAKTKGNICESVDDNAACSDTFVVTPSGSRLPVTPKFKVSTTARYAWPMGAGRAHIQGGVSHQSSALADIRRDLGGGSDPNDFLGRIRASTIVDLFAGYSWRNMNVELFGTNVFDKRNDLSRFVVCSVCTATKIVPGRPRTIGLRAGMKF